MKIYISKPEDRITSKIKRGYYLKLETMKLLWSWKSKITKDENGKKVAYLEIMHSL